MAADRLSGREVRCAILWRLARSHGWGHWIPEEQLIRAVPSHERGRAKNIVTRLADEPIVRRHLHRGLKLAHESVDRLARELRDECGFSEFRIETTLSHFGGFE